MSIDNDLDHIKLRSEEVQEILTKVPHWMIRWGNTLFLILILLVLFISWMIKYPEILEARAVLTTVHPPQKLWAKVTGKIDTILVRENELVVSGQPVAVIENPADFEDVVYLKSVLDAVDPGNENVVFSFTQVPVLFLGPIEADYATFVNTYLEYSLNRELSPYSSRLQADKVSLSEIKHRLLVLQNQKEMEKIALDFQRKSLARSKVLFEKGVVSADEFEQRGADFARSRQNYSNLDTNISQLQEAIAAAQNTSRGTEIEQIIKQETLRKTLILAYNQLQVAIKNWEQTYVLISQVRGKVTFTNYWSENQTVQQGDLVFTVLPERHGDFIAKLSVPGRNTGKLKTGQRTTIELESYPEEEYGVLEGEVQSISSVPDKEGFYHVGISFSGFTNDKKLITSYQKEIDFKQEMVGFGKINMEDLRW